MANDDPNPYHREAPAVSATAASVGVEEIGTAACWRLVEANSLGRLAMQNADGHPDVFPLNYLVHEGNLYLRSAPGTKLRSLLTHPEVALEIDGIDDAFHWSVVIRGTATRMDADADIEASGVLGLVSSSPTAKRNYVRLVPDTVTGRRFPVRGSASASAPAPAPAPEDARSASTERSTASGEQAFRKRTAPHRTADKPQPIPHVSPWGGD